MKIVNHNGETFEIIIHELDNYIDENNQLQDIPWAYKCSITISQNSFIKTTKLDFMCDYLFYDLHFWLSNLYNRNFEMKRFEFIDAHISFVIYRKNKEPYLRFYIKEFNEDIKYFWDWRFTKDKSRRFIKYIEDIKKNI
jgi:hypothetical protein